MVEPTKLIYVLAKINEYFYPHWATVVKMGMGYPRCLWWIKGWAGL